MATGGRRSTGPTSPDTGKQTGSDLWTLVIPTELKA